MAFDLFLRAQAKWRGLLVYTALSAASRLVTALIVQQADTRALKLFGSLSGLATALYCVWMTYELLTRDREGDDAWPPLWS